MRRVIFLIVFVSLAAGLRADSTWKNFDQGIAQSKKEGKSMMVDFYTTWCHWCKVMDEKTFSNTEVKSYLDKHFIKVRILAEDQKAYLTYRGKKYNHVEFSRASGVRGYPSLAFFDSTGGLITVIPGFIPADNFLPILKYIKQEYYKKKISFKDFLKKQKEYDKKESK